MPAPLQALPHQQDVATRLANEPGQLVFHGLGTGKTISAINAAHHNKLPLLAITPAALRGNIRKGLAESGLPVDTQVLSYQEAVNRLGDPEFLDRASKSLVVYDEAHRAGRAGTARSDLIGKLPAAKRLLMTATPMRNEPAELAPLINAIAPGSLPATPEEFRQKFYEERKTPLSLWQRLRGVQPGIETHPKNLDQFEQAVKGKVHFHESNTPEHFPAHSEEIIETPMSDRQHAAYEFVIGKYPRLAYKIRHGIPFSKAEQRNFQSFMIGPRQVSNAPMAFNTRATSADAAKIQRMADEVERRYKTDPNYRGTSYSSFIESGAVPLMNELRRRGIPTEAFTGSIDDKERKRLVSAYNGGELPHLIISGAGSEGLDLKGTKLMQIMEPHWNEEQINQVRGRAIRYKSHSHLPENERHVEVQRFHAVPKPTWIERAKGVVTGKSPKTQGVDQYIHNLALQKQKLNEPFLRILRGEDPTKASSFVQPNGLMPGLLVDIDSTIVETNGNYCDPEAQVLLPNRLERLQQWADDGWAIIGVTNRTNFVEQGITGVHNLVRSLQRVTELTNGLIKDILFVTGGYRQPQHKPSPAMLYQAIIRHDLDPGCLLMVGDSDDDKGAAEAAGIPWVHPDEFFSLDENESEGTLPHDRNPE